MTTIPKGVIVGVALSGDCNPEIFEVAMIGRCQQERTSRHQSVACVFKESTGFENMFDYLDAKYQVKFFPREQGLRVRPLPTPVNI